MLPERIYEFRRKSGLSQEQLAESIGVSRQSVSKWESGASTPELEKLLALSECFNVSLDELVRDGAVSRETSEAPQKSEETKGSKKVEIKAGIGLCLMGAIGLMLSGTMMVISPSTAGQLNAASAITLNGSGILLVLCVFSMVIGLIFILRKK